MGFDKENEMVSHPSHYNKAGRKECIVEMEEKYGLNNTANFCLFNAYKYLYRAGEKAENSAEQDIEKARWYFEWVKKRAGEISCFNLGDLSLYLDIKGMLEN